MKRSPSDPEGPGGTPPANIPPSSTSDAYLWDKSGAPDPDIVRLEQLLAPTRMKATSLPSPTTQTDPAQLPQPRVHASAPRGREVSRKKGGWRLPALGTLALFAIIALIGWPYRPWRLNLTDWKAEAIVGGPTINGHSISKPRSVTFDSWMVTDANATLRLTASKFGTVIVQPNSRLRINNVKDGEHWFELQQGSIEATITAPPKLFFVQTPSALAVDMGCRYTLDVDAVGDGTLHVTVGWVELQRKAQVVRVPFGYKCAIHADAGPGLPVSEHASDFLIAAVERFDLRSNPKYVSKSDPIQDIIDAAGAKSLTNDAVTLWHLLREVDAPDRERVFAHLAALVPPPNGITSDAILKLEPVAMDQWWEVIRTRGGP